MATHFNTEDLLCLATGLDQWHFTTDRFCHLRSIVTDVLVPVERRIRKLFFSSSKWTVIGNLGWVLRRNRKSVLERQLFLVVTCGV